MAKQYAKANSKPAHKESEGHKSVTRFFVNPSTKWISGDNLTLWNLAAEERGAFVFE
jgi:hypothetical protein